MTQAVNRADCAVMTAKPRNKVVLVFAHKHDNLVKPRLPLASLAMAPYLTDEGFDVEVLDTRMRDYKSVDWSNVLCVGFTAWTGNQIKYSLDVAKYIRSTDPSIKLIWGGAHPEALPEQTLDDPRVDIVARGEGELTMAKIAVALRDGINLKDIKGIVIKTKDQKYFYTPPVELADMGDLKRPLYDLVDVSKYNTEIFHYYFSRGCPHRCEFCADSVFKQATSYRTKPIAQVIEELKWIKEKFHPKIISFVDDNVFVNRIKAKELFVAIKEANLGLKYTASCRFDYFSTFDKDFITLLKDAGLQTVHFGGESGSQDMLDYIKKDVKLSQMVRSIELSKIIGLNPQSSFIIGLPEERPTDLMRTLNFIDMIHGINENTDINGIFLFTPLPGTALYNKAIQLGFKPPKTFEEWGDYNFGKVTDVPWLKKLNKNYLLTIELISRFPFLEHKLIADFEKHKKLPFFHELAYKFYRWNARQRWKHKFFRFNYEWRLFHYVRKGYSL